MEYIRQRIIPQNNALRIKIAEIEIGITEKGIWRKTKIGTSKKKSHPLISKKIFFKCCGKQGSNKKKKTVKVLVIVSAWLKCRNVHHGVIGHIHI